MTLKIVILALVAIQCLVPVDLGNYDLLIIPLPNVATKTKKVYELNLNKRPKYKNRKWPYLQNLGDKDDRVDIEHYEEPTETPDIDHFDYEDRTVNDLNYDNQKVTNVGQETKDLNVNQNYGDDKIVGGTEVEINLYPYHVAYGTNCGGAIIHKQWIITAGHCGKKPYIRHGSKYLSQGKKVNVINNYIHPMWASKSKEHPFDYDFQLLELGEPIRFDDNSQPIKVAHIEDMVIGKVVTVTGWGNTEENGPYSNILRAVRVPIISKENCQNVPFPYFRGSLTQRMFCAGFHEGKKDACQGDSGGPAAAYDRLLGVVSFGYGCATPGSYGVYSKVAKVRPWIEETTGLTLN